MDNFDRKKYLYYSEKWKGNFPKETPKFKKVLNLFRSDRREVEKLEKKFIDEITLETPDWVRERRLEFMEGELKKINKEYLCWINIVNLCIKWFGLAIYETCAVPFKKEREKIYREINLYKNPRTVENQSLSEEEIEMASSASCDQFVDVKIRIGNKSWSLCPFHEDTKPSLCCYEGEKGFYCYSCNHGGNAIHLVRQIHGFGFKDAVMFINNK